MKIPVLFTLVTCFCLSIVCTILVSVRAIAAQPKLFIAYPPPTHQTTANKIFFIGTAPVSGPVLVNGQAIARSAAGHFAPSFPLQIGANQFTFRYGTQEIKRTVTRETSGVTLPVGNTFAKDSLTPAVNIGRLPDELICFGAIAPPGATVGVRLGTSQTVPLQPQAQFVELPPNSALLTQQNQPVTVSEAGFYRGCGRTVLIGDLGRPVFELNLGGNTTRQLGTGNIQILSPTQLEVAEVTADIGTARTGPSTDYSRLTPLPKGTLASVTGYEGDWVRLDYGAWIKRQEVQVRRMAVPPTSLIRSVKARSAGNWTEIVFPLQVPVPVTVQQGDRTFTLTLHNTTAQTDTVRLDDDPLIARLDWQQNQPGQVQYTFNLKTTQQWGYTLRYEGTSLVLALKHPPNVKSGGKNAIAAKPLAGTKILLDPGHGGPEDLGSVGPTGLPEKAVALKTSKLLRDELIQRGATVVMTRDKDADVGLQDRVNLIATSQPTLALSIHYNALPDSGDAIKTQGISTFWYQTQGHSLAVFLHNYLVKTLKRSSYGVFWNNLALTRPSTTPAVLLELGFMINPNEYEWIVNGTEQKKLARAIADGVTAWLYSRS
ncbi:N-acetylmuramoyl-L-alanine amidase [Phormidium sp. CLA17]|uniref:N-acetylmuramoyl-L-alanine amidase n=1 Tax=Leptolyngbya sp. Cla-17 TaxID=2803751 RepID=UPI001492C824|nr:N-acetylmuramoyl-L-alanine amidase [Leptolyngbya sp. Cla-17]MBM0741020.1 N-acetylmuramoyl-L-alanine amidase [Leptolyngbya sp. Cla-17]